MRFLVDTNVISELRKGERCDAGVANWFESVDKDSIFLSVLTLGEIRRGVEAIRRRDPSAAARLEDWLATLTKLHAARIVPIDAQVADLWGRLDVPDPLPVIDALLGATARVHGMTVVSRNVDDIGRTGAEVLQPFVADQ